MFIKVVLMKKERSVNVLILVVIFDEIAPSPHTIKPKHSPNDMVPTSVLHTMSTTSVPHTMFSPPSAPFILTQWVNKQTCRFMFNRIASY